MSTKTCRQCGQREAAEEGRRLCEPCIAVFADHRRPEPYRDCAVCGRASTVTYECTACQATVAVAGRYVWQWQGRGHWHKGDGTVLEEFVSEHCSVEHDGFVKPADDDAA